VEPIAVFYLGVAVGVAGASLASPPRTSRILAFFNLGSCIVANGLQLNLPALYGLDPLSSIDGIGLSLGLMAWVIDRRKTWTLVVAGAFGLQLAFHVFFALDLVSRLNYRRALNGLFMVQEVAILALVIIGRLSPYKRSSRKRRARSLDMSRSQSPRLQP
jgi:hypothetical protein